MKDSTWQRNRHVKFQKYGDNMEISKTVGFYISIAMNHLEELQKEVREWSGKES